MKRSILIFALWATLLGIAHATTFTVSNTNDSGTGSLRQAILSANADATATAAAPHQINFTVPNGSTIAVISPFLVIANHVSINGLGMANLTISGGGTSRIFWIQNGTITIQNLTLANGYAKGGDGSGGGMGAGGAIFMHEGKEGGTGSISLSLTNVNLSNNRAVGGTGGITYGPAYTIFGGGGMGGNGGVYSYEIYGITLYDAGGGGVLGNGSGGGGSVTNANNNIGGNNGGLTIFGNGGDSGGTDGRSGGFGAGGGGGTTGGNGGFGAGGGGGNECGHGGFGGGGGGGTIGGNGGFGGGGGRGTRSGGGGFGAGNGGMGAGGGIFVASGRLNLTGVTFNNNSSIRGNNGAKGYGGALFVFNKADNGGNAAPGTTNDPVVSMCNVTFNGNTADDDNNTHINNDNYYASSLPSLTPRGYITSNGNAVSSTICSGRSIQLVFNGVGTEPFYFVVNGKNYNTVSGSGFATLTEGTDFTGTQNFNLTRIADANNCAVTSSIGSVIVNVNEVNPGSIGEAQSVCSGGDPQAFNSVSAGTGGGVITYRWEKSTTDCNSGFLTIMGATGATYDAPAGLTQMTHYRRVAISNLDGVVCEATSNCVTVSMRTVSGGTVSGSQLICTDGNATAFTSTEAGSGQGTITYRWESSTTDCISGYSPIMGATGETYDPPAGSIGETTFFRRVTISTLNGTQCQAIAPNCIVVIVLNPQGGAISGNQSLCSNANPTAITSTSAGSSNAGTITYRWESSTTDCNSGFSTIMGATDVSYDPPAGLSSTTYFRRVTIATFNGVGSGVCEAISNCVTITIQGFSPPTITCPATQTLTLGANCLASLPDYRSLATTDDDCGVQSVTQSPVAGTVISGSGNLSVTLTVTDINNLTNSCIFTVTKVDNTPPTVTCPANISVNSDKNQCFAVVSYNAPVSSNNCSAATTVQTTGLASGSAFPVGTTTNTFEVTSNGQKTTCSFTVTVVDAEPPTITCPANISVNNDAGQCSAVVTYTAPVGSDNCSGATTKQIAGLASGAAFPVGTTTNTFEVTANGQKTSCSFTVTVVDAEPPTITCPANISVNNDAGKCSAVVTYTAPVGTDNCSGATTQQIAGLASGAAFPVGTTTNTFEVTSNGQKTTCSFTVTVVDAEPPTITCPANISVNNDAGKCSAVVNYTAPVGTDNCSGATTVQTTGLASGSAFPVGTTTNTFEVTANGQKTTCSFTVTVVDAEPPTITCPANISVNNDAGKCSAVVNYTAPVGTDNCSGATTTQIAGLASGAVFPVGTTTNTFEVTSNGQKTSCSFTVTVVDAEPPTITCPANISVNNDAGKCSAVVNYTAPVGSDNCSGATTTQIAGLASGAAFPVGTTTNTFEVTSNGQKTTCSFTVTVVDAEPPTITCPANISVNNEAGKCSAVVTYTAPVGTDNCSGATTQQIAGLASGAAFPVGTTTNTFEVTANGQKTTCSFTVTVVDAEPPTITCPANISVNNDAGKCSAVVNYTAPVGTDNCSGATTQQIAGLASGAAFPVGTTTNTFEVTANGQKTSCSFTVTVVDAEPPMITCPANISVNNDAGKCSAVVTYTAPVGSDNCSGATTAQIAGLASGAAFPVGTTTNTFEVTANGQKTSCSFTVTVVDAEPPMITCPANISVNNDAGKCSAVVNYTAPVGTDNCSGATTAQIAGLASGSAFPVGTTTNTFEVTSNGQKTTCSFTVTVVDAEPPTITCPANISVNNDAGQCSAVVTYTAPVGSDNCSGATTKQIAGLASGAAFPVGTTTNTFEVTANGQKTSCSFTVTVVDAEPPMITCPANIVVCANTLVTYVAPVGTDNCSGAVTTQTSGLGTGVVYPVGVTTNTFKVTAANGQTTECSFTVTVIGKPTITLSTLQQTLTEGNNPVLCDTDANPVNSLQFNVSGLCVSGSPVWRVQVGSGAWSTWSATAPVSQPSNNQPHRYQAACDASCTSTYSGVIELTINNRATVPQNVSLLVDGVTVSVGETKEVCSLVTIPLTFNANCAAGEVTLYSVDGGEYSSGVPTGLVDNQYHNYRVRCRKSDGTASCVESESGVMRLKLVTIPSAPTVSLSSTSSCDATASFSGQSSCGTLRTVWYNAATNVALPNLPSVVPSQTTSYYARCQTENGCVSEKSNVVTFTLAPTQVAPVITASQEIVCTGTSVTISANCPAGSQTFWNTGVTTPSFEVSFNNVTKQTYWAKCIFVGGCQSSESVHKDIYWNAFVVTLINVGESKSSVKVNDRAAWTNQFITRDGGPELEQSTQQNPTLYYVENANKIAPRYWTINVEACGLSTDGSLTFDMLATPEMGVIRSFNTHENNAPYFMYANREGWTELYAQNHPAYGFYQDNGAGGNVYDTGLPKGLYKLGIRYWDMKGWGSIYPSTRKPQGSILAYQEYWFRIQSKDGVGVGAARTAEEQVATTLSSVDARDLNPNVFAQVMPNPVSTVLRLQVQDRKGQSVQTVLTDASGRQVLRRMFVAETNTHQEEFGVSELPMGMYFLRVTTPEKQTTLKVVKVGQ